jgi:hypothetical protein
VGDALASSKRSGKSTGPLLASYAAAYALRHTHHADPPYPLAPPRKIGRNKSDEAVGVSFGQHSSYPGCLLPGFISVSSLGLVVARLSGLWLALASLALFEPIAVAVQFEDVDVVGQSVEQRTGQPLGPDDLMMPPSSKELCVVLVFSTQRSACSKG